MDFMRGLPDGFFDLVIADPPYGIGEDSMNGRGKLKNRAMNKMNTTWDKAPDKSFFKELLRVSVDQIIWGGNYFDLPPTRGILVWDKVQPWENFSQIEYAWTSFNIPAKLFKFDNRTGFKIHPTQKPVALYKWLLTNYAKPGHKTFDPMMGSQSSRIAAWDMGFDYWGCELDGDYYREGEARFKAHTAKPVLFAPEQMYSFEQSKLFQD